MFGRSRTSRGMGKGLLVAAAGALLVGTALAENGRAGDSVFRAGSAAVDITPEQLPVKVVGGFLERTSAKIHDRIYARCLVLDDDKVRVAIVVVDSCALPRDLLDQAKGMAHRTTGIPVDRMLISATHTHSAPAAMGALGTDCDEGYRKFLPGRIAKAIEQAAKNLSPAKVGWAVVDDREHTNCRRWIRRPDKIGVDPFGRRTIRAMMHPGYQNPDYLGPAGPIDPGLSLLSVQSRSGRPIALLANYSMHYFGAPPISADYYGLFVEKFTELVGAKNVDPPFVAMMSQGTSGDLHWMDYSKPKKPVAIRAYAEAVARVAYEAYKQIAYHERVPIAMSEKKLTLRRRVPDEKRLTWAKQILVGMQCPTPRNKTEVYAREQVLLAERPTAELKLQAIRIGEAGIATIPCEVYGLTGLRIKAQSPLRPTFNIALANGCEGYIPPPDQHKLGGYTTWEARSAGLEVQAEPRIVQTLLGLLEDVAGEPRRRIEETHGRYAKAVLASKPLAYWRLGEFGGPRAADAAGGDDCGLYQNGVAFYLSGPQSPSFCGEGQVNRAPQFAGGRMAAKIGGLTSPYTVEMWFYNCLPKDVRAVTGYLFSRGRDGVRGAGGDHLGIGGGHSAAGKLIFYNGDKLKELLCGKTMVRPKTWHHLAMVRDARRVTAYLDGKAEPEISGEMAVGCPGDIKHVFIGGRSDNFANFEGKIDEVAIYGRALPVAEIAEHHALAGLSLSQKD